MQRDSKNLVGESSRAVEGLRSTISETLNVLRYEHNNLMKDPKQLETSIAQLGHELRESLLALEFKLLALTKETTVLRRLSFNAMFRREDEIAGPGYGTFEWLFEGLDPVNNWHTGWFRSHDREAGSNGNRSGWNSGSKTHASLITWAVSSLNSESELEKQSRISDDKVLSSDEHQSDEEYERTRHNATTIDSGLANRQQPTESGTSNPGRHPGGSDGNECGDTECDASTENSLDNSSNWSLEESDGDWSKDHGGQAPGSRNERDNTAPPKLKLHGVYFRSIPAISKVQGNDPTAWHSSLGGWGPHLEHIMSISERAKRRKISMGFASFLSESNGVFFCCGKAGSGKSTLMKYIHGHPEVRRQLERWSGDKRLVLISIFFWNSGDQLQMSMEGFYRCLLFQVVQQCPEILPEIFPDRRLQKNSDVQRIRGEFLPSSFRFSELEDATRKLLATSEFPSHRFCFFIDGLDEYKGDSREHVALAQLLNSWATRDVKVICSARPHIEFLDTFTDPNRIIHLHEWTKDDIYRYVWSELHGALRSADMSTESLTKLVEIVSRKANGVFIWARLVVTSLLQGMTHRDSMKALHDRVDQAPEDLNLLYEKVLVGIDPGIRERADDALLLVALSPFGALNAMAFSWLDDLQDDTFPFNRPFQVYSPEEVEDRTDIAKRQVALLTGGLVEMRECITDEHKARRFSWRVQFFDYQLEYHHLTAQDFLMVRVGATGTDKRGLSEDLRDRYARMTLAEIKFSGELRRLSPRFREIYATDDDSFYDIPDRCLDQIEAFYPLNRCLNQMEEDHPMRRDLMHRPWTTSHLGLYDDESQGQIQVGLTRQGLLWRPDTSIYHVVWKGTDRSLIICYALSLHQVSHVLRKLQSGLANEITEEELAVWLLATWTIFPDPAITEYVLSHQGLPQQPIEARSFKLEKTLHVSCWFGFLMSFLPVIQSQSVKVLRTSSPTTAWDQKSTDREWLDGPWSRQDPWQQTHRQKWIDMQCRTLEHLLKHGVDREVVFLLEEMTISQTAEADQHVFEWDEPVVDRGATFYMDLMAMLDLIHPPPSNLKILRDLLGASPFDLLRNRASSFMSSFLGHSSGSQHRLPVSEILKASESKNGQGRKFMLYAIKSKDEILTGPVTILVY